MGYDPYGERPGANYQRPGQGAGGRLGRRRGRVKLAMALGGVVAVGIGAIVVAFTLGDSGEDAANGAASSAASPVAEQSGNAAAGGSQAPVSTTLTLGATGDIVLGNAPSGLPPNDARDFFAQVKSLFGADLQMGNLEQTLTEDTGVGKCSAGSAGKTCFAFRTPPKYAKVLASAGFDLMTMANNHAYDFGQQGYTNTKAALDAAGIKYTGAPGLITVAEVKGVKVAVVGFAPYTWANDPNDLAGAKKIIAEAAGKADVVVVQVHMGAEGADRTHVKAGTETYLGERRGDPLRFSHAVIDAGADLVIGHGPHVMRGMEFYKGRLIAYSLGNFAGYRALGYSGVVGVGGVLKVTLTGDGSFVDGTLASTVMVAPGLPKTDSTKRAVKLVSGLSSTDFGETGAKIDASGRITQPA